MEWAPASSPHCHLPLFWVLVCVLFTCCEEGPDAEPGPPHLCLHSARLPGPSSQQENRAFLLPAPAHPEPRGAPRTSWSGLFLGEVPSGEGPWLGMSGAGFWGALTPAWCLGQDDIPQGCGRASSEQQDYS